MVDKALSRLGRFGTDRVTGFSGVISSVCFDLYGCCQYALTPKAGDDGKLGDGHWFDVHRVKVSSDEPVMDAPNFGEAAKEPEEFAHGPAEKPSPR